MASESTSFQERALPVRAAGAPLYILVWTALYAACLVIFAMLGSFAFGKLAYPAGERVPMLYARVQSDLRQLEAVAWPPAAPQRAAALARSLHAWVFERSGLTRRIQALSDGAGGTLDRRLASAGAGVFDDGGEGWQLAILGLYFFGVRLICVAALAPLLAGAYLLGFIDGLVARAMRIAGAGRESASLYHRAKWVLAVAGAGAPACYLTLPFALPLAEVAPFAGLAVLLLARLQWKYYKKYL